MIKQLRFNSVGELPVPFDWMPKPDIKTMPLRHHKSKKADVFYVMNENNPRQRTWYSFRFNKNSEALKRNVWRNWHSIGWEDCEVGHAFISATYYDFDDPDFDGSKYRVTWFVTFSHDGTPERYKGDPHGEFWGWNIESVSSVCAFKGERRDKTPVTYEYHCKHINGASIRFQITGNGSYDCEVKAKKKVDEDPNLRKMHLVGEKEFGITWDREYYFGGSSFISKEVA